MSCKSTGRSFLIQRLFSNPVSAALLLVSAGLFVFSLFFYLLSFFFI